LALFPNLPLAKGLAALGGCLVLAGLGVAAVRQRSLFAAVAASAAAVSVTAYDTPQGLHITAVWVTVALAAVAVSVGLARLTVALTAVAHLTDDLRSGLSPDAVLRTHLADPSARVEFVVPSSDRSTLWVTADGGAVDELSTPVPTPQHTTLVHSRGRPVARLHHSRAPVTLTPELALVLEQAGLAAGLAHQVSELEESRTRIVQLADSERRQLERDLHDGAQQYLLALALELSLTAPELEGALDDESRDALRQSRADAEAALNELRAVARGTYPVLLESGGLRPALQELGRRSGAAVTVHDTGTTSLPPAAAAALCGLVEELAASGCTRLAVDVDEAEPPVVQVTGGTPAHESLNLERLAASGGMVEVMPGRTVVRFS
jgi:signal transduction histidine kinase